MQSEVDEVQKFWPVPRSPEVLVWTFMRDMDGGQPLRLQPRHLDTDQVSLDIIDQRRLFRLK